MKQQSQEQINLPQKLGRARKTSHFYVGPLKHVINLFLTKRLTQGELSDHTGLNHLTSGRYIRELHRGPKNLIYICDYLRTSTVGPLTAVYTWGPGEQDVLKPVPKSKSGKQYRAVKARKAAIKLTETGMIHHVK